MPPPTPLWWLQVCCHPSKAQTSTPWAVCYLLSPDRPQGLGWAKTTHSLSAWCLFLVLCTPALSVSPGLPLTAMGTGSTPEMSRPQRQGSVPIPKLFRQKTGSELFCLRGKERNLQGVSFWKITFLCMEGTLER